jgi:hypothetical protein
MQTIVINPIGEAGSGKSTFSLWLTQALKMRGVIAEYVPEVIKGEFFSQENVDRVNSGKFDHRTLIRQNGFIAPLLGNVEVVVNDGCLPVFQYYWSIRCQTDHLSRLRSHLDLYMERQSTAEHRYVAMTRQHPYEAVGRCTEEMSFERRTELFPTLKHEFGIVTTPLERWGSKEAFADALAQEVLASHPKPTVSRPKP